MLQSRSDLDGANASVVDTSKSSNARVPSTAPAIAPRRLLSTLTSEERKQYPMATGLIDYFPDALAMVAHVSFIGNQKHNPGQPLHWSRAKSADHADCVVRHVAERHGVDTSAPGVSVPHMAEACWRGLADLQLALEKQHNLTPPASAK